MPKNNNSYWAERARKDKLKVIRTGERGIDNLKRLLLLNLKDVEKQIKEFYDKYGDNPAEELSNKNWQRYKKRLSDMAKANPQDKTLRKLAQQNIPKYQIDRLRALELDLQMLLTEATIGQEKGIYSALDDVSKVSQATLAKRYKDTFNLTFNAIASNKMKQILMSDWSGANWSERLWKDREKVGKKLTEVLEKGIPQGTSLQKMSRELRDLTGESYNNAFRLIRTETSHIDGQVTLEGYKQAGQELGLEYYEYDAFLDSRTSNICRDLDKKRFKVSEAEVGVNYPPMHPNCRSTTQLVLDDDYKQEEKQKENFEKDINVPSKEAKIKQNTSRNDIPADEKENINKGKIIITKTYTGADKFVNGAIANANIDKTTKEILENLHKLPEVEVKKNSVKEAFTPALGTTKAKLTAGSEKAFYHEFGHSLDYAVAKKIEPNNPKFNWLSNELTEINQKIINKLNYKIPHELENKFVNINNQVKDIFRDKYVDKVAIEVKANINKKYKNFFTFPQQLQNSIANDEYEKLTIKYYKKAISETPDYTKWSCLSDVYDALTVGKASKSQSMLGTHGEYYYQDLGTGIKIGNSHPINTEIFANYVEMRLGDYQEQLKFLKDNEPDLYNKLDMVYNKVARELKNAK